MPCPLCNLTIFCPHTPEERSQARKWMETEERILKSMVDDLKKTFGREGGHEMESVKGKGNRSQEKEKKGQSVCHRCGATTSPNPFSEGEVWAEYNGKTTCMACVLEIMPKD